MLINWNKKNVPIAIGASIGCLFLVSLYLMYGRTNNTGSNSFSYVKGLESDASGVTGKSFSGLPFREFGGRKKFANYRPPLDAGDKPVTNSKCKYWIVFTTIFEISDSVTMFKKVVEKHSSEWCCVAVLDKKTPESSYLEIETERFKILTVKKQQELSQQPGFSLIKNIPYNSFGRKNIGFLYAINQGAQIIYDTDDDNLLKEDYIPFTTPAQDYTLVASENHVYNPYKYYKPDLTHSFWPRGIPMDFILKDEEIVVKESDTECKPSSPEDITLYQLVADHDPDVDAIYRLTNPLPLYFDKSRDKVLVLQSGTISPMNAQCLVTHYDALFGLYMPYSINGRVADIWRSYYIQGLQKSLGHYAAFGKAYILQYRNVHDYLADFNSEIPLYTQATELVKLTLNWQSNAPYLVQRMEELAIHFYERGYFELGDVYGIQRWIADLIDLGYRFPPIRGVPLDCPITDPEENIDTGHNTDNGDNTDTEDNTPIESEYF